MVKLSVRSDDINYAIYRYMVENGYQHTAFTFKHEADVRELEVLGGGVMSTTRANKAKSVFPAHCLVSLIQKAMVYMWMEFHTDADEGTMIECEAPFSLFKPHICSARAPKEEEPTIKPRKSTVRGDSSPPTTRQRPRKRRSTPVGPPGFAKRIATPQLTSKTPPLLSDTDHDLERKQTPTSRLEEKVPRSPPPVLELEKMMDAKSTMRRDVGNSRIGHKLVDGNLIVAEKPQETGPWEFLGRLYAGEYQDPNLRSVDWSPNKDFLVAVIEDRYVHESRVVMFRYRDGEFTSVTLGAEANAVLNFQRVIWATSGKAFKVKFLSRRGQGEYVYRCTEDLLIWKLDEVGTPGTV